MRRQNADVGLIRSTVVVFAIGFAWSSFALAEEPASPPAPSTTMQEEKATPADSSKVQERAVIRDLRETPGAFTPSQGSAPPIVKPMPNVVVPAPLVSPTVSASGAGYGGWNIVQHVRLMADLDRDSRQDIVAFGDGGVYTARSIGTGFAAPRFEFASLGYNQAGRHRTLADVNADGVKDIVAFNDDGVWTALATGNGFFSWPRFVLPSFGLNQGWRVGQHIRLMADVNRDGRQDIVGFHDEGVVVALSTGTGFAMPAPVFPYFGWNQRWRVENHVRLMADLNGDGRQDIVGFGDAAVWTALSFGTGFATPTKAFDDFAYNQGWRVEKHVRLMANLSASFADIVAFGDAGVWVAMSAGNYFNAPKFVLADFGYNQGWRVEKHVRLMADINADGRADIVAFGDAGVNIALATGNGGFAPWAFVLADFGSNTPQAAYHTLAVSRVMESGVGVSITTSDVDRIFLDATRVLLTNDGPSDVACPVILARTGNILEPVGPLHIDSNDELQRVLNLPGNVKVVEEIDYCGGLNPMVVGCASKTLSFPSLTVERILAVKEGSLWAHEYGHTKQLEHRDDSPENVMNKSIKANESTANLKINAAECAAFQR